MQCNAASRDAGRVPQSAAMQCRARASKDCDSMPPTTIHTRALVVDYPVGWDPRGGDVSASYRGREPSARS